MKNIYVLIITFFVLVVSAQAQVTIYKEDFSAIPAGTAAAALPIGYVATAGTWARNNQHVVAPNNQVSGGHYLKATGANNIVELTGISVKEYGKIQVKWAGVRVGYHNTKRNSFPIRLEYSVNNGSYTAVTISAENLSDDGVWRQVNNGNPIVLPTLPATANTVSLRWTVDVETHKDGYYGIDDITITADKTSENDVFSWASRPYDEDPFIASGPTAQNPYTLDYVPMRWTRSASAPVVLNTSSVRNERFQSPNKSLTLVQTGATATQGSNISIAFEDNMADLKFTLFDVDQHSGQFQDRIVITAVNSLGEKVVLKNENVLRGSTISFDEATGAITGNSGQDITSNSDQGNVVVTFPAPVMQVTIAYFNLDGTRSNQGSQGISIYNISGRVAGNISPLPVELTSFRGQRNSQGVNLTWATASEQENSGFEVEASTDGKSFRKIGFVLSKVGTTSIAQFYSFTDSKAVAGVNYYRLKQVDFDGTSEYSKTVAVNMVLAASASVYPTLATEQITVRLAGSDEQVVVQLADMTGKQLAAVHNPSERELVMPVQHLQRGVYFVSVITGGNKEVFRFVKR